MTKFTSLALIAAAAFAVTSANADDKGCCATQAKNSKMDCSQTYAKLNLSPEQKVKLDALAADCDKGGCTKQTTEKFMKSAKAILSKEQFAALKTECARMHDKGAKA